MIDEQFSTLKLQRTLDGAAAPTCVRLESGAYLVCVSEVKLPSGWNREAVDVLFVLPPGYPAAPPDCFWVEPVGLRLVDGGTPQNSNDANPIPGDTKQGRQTTWFSWHLQGWDPSRGSLLTYFNVILQRLKPAR